MFDQLSNEQRVRRRVSSVLVLMFGAFTFGTIFDDACDVQFNLDGQMVRLSVNGRAPDLAEGSIAHIERE
jgi:hypothetical protein